MMALRPVDDRDRFVGVLSFPRSRELARMDWRGIVAGLHHCPVRGDVWISAHDLSFDVSAASQHSARAFNRSPLATLLGYGPVGAVVEMAIGSVFIVIGLLLVIKGWTRIYFTATAFRPAVSAA